MKILITGGSGFVGSHVVEAFTKNGHTVRVLARRTSDISNIKNLGVEIVYGDLAQKNSLTEAVDGMDALVNLAATMGGQVQEFQAATIAGTHNLFLAAEHAGIKRIVHTSSIAVLAHNSHNDQNDIPEDGVFESDPDFQNIYVTAKQESERTALSFNGHYGIRVIVLRPGLVFGPGGTWKLPRMGYSMGNNFFIIGNGKNKLPVTYVKNLADAVLMSVEKQSISGGVFNIIDDELFTQQEFLERYKRDVNPELKIKFIPRFLGLSLAKAGKIAGKLTGLSNPFQMGHIYSCYSQLTYSTRKVKSVLCWQPKYKKEDALTATMLYFSGKQKISRRSDLSKLGEINDSLPPVRVALIGCGVIADTHMQFLADMSNIKVVACCDPDPENAKKMTGKWNVPAVYDSVETMLEDVKPDAVHMMVPPQFNSSIAMIAIKHGCHIFMEKPMAVNSAEAGAIIKAAAARGVKVCVDHNHLYDSVMVKARRIIESGALGKVTWVDSYYGFDLGSNRSNRLMLPGGENNWTFQLPGGLFQNLLPHPLSVALDVIGEPISSYAHARFFRILPHQPMDELRILLETRDAGGLVTVSLAASPKFQTLTVYGTKGSLLVDFAHKIVVPQIHLSHVPKSVSRLIMNMRWGTSLIRGTLRMVWQVLRKKWIHFDGMNIMIREFYSTIQENRPSPVDPADLLHMMRVMDKTWEQVGQQNVFSRKKEY